MQGVCRPGALLGVSGVRPVLPLWPPPLGWALLTRTSGPAALVAPGPCRVSTLPLLGDKLPGTVTATPGPGPPCPVAASSGGFPRGRVGPLVSRGKAHSL